MSSPRVVSEEANGRLYEVREQRDEYIGVYYELVVYDMWMGPYDEVTLFEEYCSEPHHEYDMDFFVAWVDEAIAMDARRMSESE